MFVQISTSSSFFFFILMLPVVYDGQVLQYVFFFFFIKFCVLLFFILTLYIVCLKMRQCLDIYYLKGYSAFLIAFDCFLNFSFVLCKSVIFFEFLCFLFSFPCPLLFQVFHMTEKSVFTLL